jgi:hypothetical protein
MLRGIAPVKMNLDSTTCWAARLFKPESLRFYLLSGLRMNEHFLPMIQRAVKHGESEIRVAKWWENRAIRAHGAFILTCCGGSTSQRRHFAGHSRAIR